MKIVYISTILPSGHFAQYYTKALVKEKDINLILYTDTNPENKKVKGVGTVKAIWKKNYRFIFNIVKHIFNDKPDVVHIQQEFNMYGDILTAVMFPFLIFFLKLLGNRVVVTIHAAVFKKQVTKKFITLFTTRRSITLNTFTLKLFFHYTYFLTSIFADALICHTNLLKEILVSDYMVDESKIHVIPTGIPPREFKKMPRQPYFFCFGYLVRRKGFEYVFNGFKKFVKKKKYRNYKLVLAGGTIKGQEHASDEIRNMIKTSGLSKNIEVKGFIEEDRLDELYGKATAVLIPARISMGSSGPLYQALSYGKCVLASNIGHFKEDITHLKDGFLVKNSEWDTAFEHVIEHPETIRNIENNVLEKIKVKSSQVIAKKHLKVYRTITT